MGKAPRTIFIGDIHGCYDEFILLLEKLEITKEDKVYLVGDLIIKGPDDIKVLKFLYDNKKQFKSVMGNAEYSLKLLSIDSETKVEKWEKELKKLYKELKKDYPKILKWIIKLPTFIEEKDFILVHAGLQETIENTKIGFMTGYDENEFDKKWYNTYLREKKVIFGHNSTYGIRVSGNNIGIDSGCVFGGYLTAYTLETGHMLQQKSFKTYYKSTRDPRTY